MVCWASYHNTRFWCLIVDLYLTRVRPAEAHVYVGLPHDGAGDVDGRTSSHKLMRGLDVHKWRPTRNCENVYKYYTSMRVRVP